ncbi:MAG: CYTH domain-containing protein [Muribaculaceae bacterium]|nr:CYTH domain-containing protein [Muribaculaceae bacterium]
MAKEIERKFLTTSDSYKTAAFAHTEIIQGYLSTSPDATVRLRLHDDKAYITVKTRTDGCTRGEWEYEIPHEEALEMLPACGTHLIEKTRWLVAGSNGLTWEVDEFHGRHAGLVVAEIELPSEDSPFERPDFIGAEVTGQPQYYNSVLSGV